MRGRRAGIGMTERLIAGLYISPVKEDPRPKKNRRNVQERKQCWCNGNICPSQEFQDRPRVRFPCIVHPTFLPPSTIGLVLEILRKSSFFL